ncbi:MAG: hypothetical protein EOO66_06785, partial [Methylobacterium sp.]
LNKIPEYSAWFGKLFPKDGVTQDNILTAIATYERTVVAGTAPFDRWVEGDESAISPAAQRGFDLFTGKAACAGCHTGWNFTDNKFHDIGIPTKDVGRAAFGDDRTHRLGFQVRGPAVPEHRRDPGSIEDGGSLAHGRLVVRADRSRDRDLETERRVVAAGAGEVLLAAQARIEEQHLAEGRRLRRIPCLFGKGDQIRSSIGGLGGIRALPLCNRGAADQRRRSENAQTS